MVYSGQNKQSIDLDHKKIWEYKKDLDAEDRAAHASMGNRFHQYYLRKKRNKDKELLIKDADLEDEAMKEFQDEINEIIKSNKAHIKD